jgi:hypothetical protein
MAACRDDLPPATGGLAGRRARWPGELVMSANTLLELLDLELMLLLLLLMITPPPLPPPHALLLALAFSPSSQQSSDE